MTSLDQKLEVWKNKLLDTGKRNRLMNYRDTKRSNLRILTPEMLELWQSFVVDESPLEFDYYDDEQNAIFEDDEAVDLRRVITNQTPKDQQRTLRNLRAKAKIAKEEQGVNILYLSFGFLKWSESSNSEQYFLSPIILVPAILTVESITDPYILSLHEDEIVVNPTLANKLENDFGIKLPAFDEGAGLDEYLRTIATLIPPSLKWQVVTDVGLSLLSFLKINMYNDLDARRERIMASPIVRAITGDATALNGSVEDINGFDHDAKTRPTEIFQVLDADSSQQDAVIFAKKGGSFILQGAPGTGKSQTITNIIAECLADGKKVLFVSEKMAALEVVQRRLAKIGLDDFSLSLHSHKANKKEVLEQLRNVFEMAGQKASLSDEAFQRLDRLQECKENLNEYVKAIFTKIAPFGKTIYAVNGYIAELQLYEEVVFGIDNIHDVTPQKFNRMVNALNKFANVVGEKSDDQKRNPWNSANMPAVSHELRHDTGANLGKLIPKIDAASVLYDQIEAELSLTHASSYNGLCEIADLLETASRSPMIPIQWILGDDIAPLFSDIDEHAKAKAVFSEGQTFLTRLYADIKAIEASFDMDQKSTLYSPEELCQQVSALEQLIANNALFSGWKRADDFDEITAAFSKVREQVEAHNAVRAELLDVFEAEIFTIDYKAMQARFKSEYTSVFKVFNSQYKADKKAIRGLYRDVVKKVNDDSVVATLTSLRKIDEIKQALDANSSALLAIFGSLYHAEKTDVTAIATQISMYERVVAGLAKLEELKQMSRDIADKESNHKRQYDYLYNGINTDWVTIHSSLTWASEFRRKTQQYNASVDFTSAVCTDSAKISLCKQFHADLVDRLKSIDLEFVWFLGLFDAQDELKSMKMPALTDRLIACRDGLARLDEWLVYRQARTDCQSEGIGNYIEKIEAMGADIELIIPMFKKRFYRLWLDAVSSDYPAVMNFRRASHESLISEFAKLDTLQFDIAKGRIQKKLMDGVPQHDRFTSGTDEVSILKREFGKQRRIKPIRRLFREIPNLLLTLKPCLMMSPLSVSLYLESDVYMFDVVIFDEASQVCTENAIGAISRGKQVIIAGDSKQLPPTNFFSASFSDSDFDVDEEDDDESNAYESILDEAAMLPERTLRWHYRSRHEELIAFSNAKIYKNNLITFPSNVDRVPDNGVEYIYTPEGVYDRGGKKGNVLEAKRVAELVLDHFQRFPERSLGVIAFGEAQQQVIDTTVRQMRKENRLYEQFFSEDKDEAFFIKNLENVQGDERDTIIFSIGYAKDASGKMQMLFGPLGKSGGERRLNVAITRAKHNVKLVGSIMPTDIETERISAEGPKLLRAYIDFAINGADVILRETTESATPKHESPFEEAVYNFLDRKGYKVVTQVGCSGYRIDMAIKHPTVSGMYVLGIECDGAQYHSARTARDRDRLRQDVLEGMGWKIYRIWSTDWIKDPVTEGQRLLTAVEKAIADYVGGNANIVRSQTYAEPPIAQEVFVSLSDKPVDIERQLNPYAFGGERSTSFDSIPRNASGYVDLGECIVEIVANEFPVHYEQICRKVAHLFGNEKATVKVRREVDYALQKLSTVKRKGDFLYPQSYDKITVRADGNTRSVDHISTDELAGAMFVIASTRVGITKDALCAETARAYGFSRSGGKIQAAIEAAYEQAVSSGNAKEIDGKLVVDKASDPKTISLLFALGEGRV